MDLSVPIPNRHYRELPVSSGRPLRSGDRSSHRAGADFAAAPISPPAARDAGRAGFLDRRHPRQDLHRSRSLRPRAIEDARELWLRCDPLLVQAFGAGTLRRGDLNTGAAVGWRDGEDPDALARRIQTTVKGLNVTIPES